MADVLQRTCLFPKHQALGARLVPFAGWEMPIQYQGILAEARAVRGASGVFDVSHMGRLYVSGPGAVDLLEWAFSNGIADLEPGRARYGLLCNEEGGIIDDGICYRLAEDRFLLVANAANKPAVWDWLHQWKPRFGETTLEDRTLETAMIACQGPQAVPMLDALSPGATLPRSFRYADVVIDGAEVMAARTGYTGEDGFEFILPAERGPGLWDRLLGLGATPCGLGARDVLRLEAALPLHGNDITPETNPLEAGLERFVRLDKEFAGAGALRRVRERGPSRKLVGFQVAGRQIARHGYAIQDGAGRPIGEVTSGGHSPTLDTSIGLGYVTTEFAAPGASLVIDIRGRPAKATVVPLPFYSRRRTT